MRAVTFDVSISGYLIGKALGGVTESALFGGLSGVRYGEVPEPPLPAEDWVRVEVLATGVCGTDIATLTLARAQRWSPSGRFPRCSGTRFSGA